MIVVCSEKGCGVVYGVKEPYDDPSITHGICPDCYVKRTGRVHPDLRLAAEVPLRG